MDLKAIWEMSVKMKENQKSLEGKASETNRWKRFGERALKRVKHESKLLPYEAVSAVLGYKGGEYVGKVASTTRSYIEGGNWEANNFVKNIQGIADLLVGDAVWVGGGLFQNLNQGMQDLEYGMLGGIAGALVGIYSGRKIGKYINNRFFAGNSKRTYGQGKLINR